MNYTDRISNRKLCTLITEPTDIMHQKPALFLYLCSLQENLAKLFVTPGSTWSAGANPTTAQPTAAVGVHCGGLCAVTYTGAAAGLPVKAEKTEKFTSPHLLPCSSQQNSRSSRLD